MIITIAIATLSAMSACSPFHRGESESVGSPAEPWSESNRNDLSSDSSLAPWNPRDGLCRILVIGDSLVEAVARVQADEITAFGCDVIVDGVAARSLSQGWQCRTEGGTALDFRLLAQPEPGNSTCRPSGLELLRLWSDYTTSSSALIVALGTNDAVIYSSQSWIRHWQAALRLSEGPIVFVTVAVEPGDVWTEQVEDYNASLREWCSAQDRCTLADWASFPSAHDSQSYLDRVHLRLTVGRERAAFIAAVARRVAIPAPRGPSRWIAPPLSLPPAPTTVVSVVPTTHLTSGTEPFVTTTTVAVPASSTLPAEPPSSSTTTTSSTTVAIAP